MQCCQHIYTATGSAQCSRKATHWVPSMTKGACTQHARTYDVPMTRQVAR